MPLPQPRKPLSFQQGASLIEVMIALLILALGLLGQMALQMNSLNSTQSSYYRTHAVFLANEMAARMQLNQQAVDANNYDGADTESNNYADPGCAATGCTAGDQAELDLFNWEQNIQNLIPGGEGTITRDATITDQAAFTITITWMGQDRTGMPNSANINRYDLDIAI